MGLPNGVTIEPGQSELVTQRGYFTPPFISCMLAAACSVLIRTGYKLPLARKKENTPPENLVWALHKAIDPTPSSGTSQAQTQTALQKLFGNTPPPVFFGGLSVTELVEAMMAGAGVRIIVDAGRLPNRLKQEMGTGFDGGHAWYLDDCRIAADGSVEFRIIDPMFRPSTDYAGTWAKWTEFDQAVSKTASGLVRVMFGYRNAAVPPPPTAEAAALQTIGKIVEEALP